MNIPDKTIKDCALALVNHYQRLAADFKDIPAAELEYLKISNQLSGIRLVLPDGLMADYVHSSLIGLNKIYSATLRRLRVQQLEVEQEQQAVSIDDLRQTLKNSDQRPKHLRPDALKGGSNA